MRIRIIVSFLLFIYFSIRTVPAQTDTIFNQTDANKLKQGFWKKSWPNGKLMYKGFFKNDKPVGEMHRYFESGVLKAKLVYDANGEYAHSVLFYENGKPAAEGKYFNTLKDSIWTYYSFYDKTVSATESYIKGIRHGMMINYYKNGEISEKIEWRNNKKSGIWEQYFPGNVLKLKTSYKDNKLEGEFVVYHSNGNSFVKGFYRNDHRDGRWTFYNSDGSVQKVLNYINGKAAEEEQLDAEQQNLFRRIEEAQGKFNEPDETDFLTPPANQ